MRLRESLAGYTLKPAPTVQREQVKTPCAAKRAALISSRGDQVGGDVDEGAA
jgi:hypothetical protein